MSSIFLKVIYVRASVSSLLTELRSWYWKKRYPDFCVSWNIPNEYALQNYEQRGPSLSIKDLIGDGFLYAVPKSRRSIERRLTRKHGYGKMLIPKNNIICCDTCGNFHIVNTVCGKCYQKVKNETEVMQEAIFKQLKLDPIDQDVIVLYKNDAKDKAISSGKRIIELEKERPAWFSKNLLAKDSGTSLEPSKDVGPHQPQVVIKE